MLLRRCQFVCLQPSQPTHSISVTSSMQPLPALSPSCATTSSQVLTTLLTSARTSLSMRWCVVSAARVGDAGAGDGDGDGDGEVRERLCGVERAARRDIGFGGVFVEKCQRCQLTFDFWDWKKPLAGARRGNDDWRELRDGQLVH